MPRGKILVVPFRGDEKTSFKLRLIDGASMLVFVSIILLVKVRK